MASFSDTCPLPSQLYVHEDQTFFGAYPHWWPLDGLFYSPRWELGHLRWFHLLTWPADRKCHTERLCQWKLWATTLYVNVQVKSIVLTHIQLNFSLSETLIISTIHQVDYPVNSWKVVLPDPSRCDSNTFLTFMWHTSGGAASVSRSIFLFLTLCVASKVKCGEGHPSYGQLLRCWGQRGKSCLQISNEARKTGLISELTTLQIATWMQCWPVLS